MKYLYLLLKKGITSFLTAGAAAGHDISFPSSCSGVVVEVNLSASTSNITWQTDLNAMIYNTHYKNQIICHQGYRSLILYNLTELRLLPRAKRLPKILVYVFVTGLFYYCVNKYNAAISVDDEK